MIQATLEFEALVFQYCLEFDYRSSGFFRLLPGTGKLELTIQARGITQGTLRRFSFSCIPTMKKGERYGCFCMADFGYGRWNYRKINYAR